jgi:hypothetical protein
VLGEDHHIVIADPRSTTSDLAAEELEASPLSDRELHQLTLYTWRYSLEAYGFGPSEVRDLMFLKWLHTTQRVQP